MSNIINVDDNNFEEEVLQSLVPVLVDFVANWCGSCDNQISILTQFAAQHKDKLKVCKIDIDEAVIITSKYNIDAVPTMLIFFQSNKIVEKIGLISGSDLDKLFANLSEF